MPSADFLQIRDLLKKGEIGYVTDDTPVAIRIRQVGGKAVTSVTVDNSANTLVLIDSDGTTTITLSAAATDTVGEVADAINATANWECKVLDALRADSANDTFVNGAISASVTDGVTYYDVKADTSALKAMTYRLTYDRSVGEDRPKGAHRVHLKEFKYNVNVNGASQNGVQVWEVDKTVETQRLRRVSVDATETTINWASGEGWMTGKEGNDLVVRILDATSVTDDTANFLEVVGFLE